MILKSESTWLEQSRQTNILVANDESFTGHLPPLVGRAFSQHVIGGIIVLPGVGYLEMAFSYGAPSWTVF